MGCDDAASATPVQPVSADSGDFALVADRSSDGSMAIVLEGHVGLSVSEQGTSAAFRVRLAEAPPTTVVVPIVAQDPTEVVAEQERLTFTPDNWNAFQEVRVRGVDDFVADGVREGRIALGPPTSPTVVPPPTFRENGRRSYPSRILTTSHRAFA